MATTAARKETPGKPATAKTTRGRTSAASKKTAAQKATADKKTAEKQAAEAKIAEAKAKATEKPVEEIVPRPDPITFASQQTFVDAVLAWHRAMATPGNEIEAPTQLEKEYDEAHKDPSLADRVKASVAGTKLAAPVGSVKKADKAREGTPPAPKPKKVAVPVPENVEEAKALYALIADALENPEDVQKQTLARTQSGKLWNYFTNTVKTLGGK